MNILFFSYLSRDKGFWVAFHGAQKILEENKDITFTFAGPVEDDDIGYTLKGLELYYPKRVKVLGYIESPVEKAKIFKSADIFIFPTLRESFGLVLLEAMSFGLPIVASKEGCIPEILMNGILFEKGNVLDFIEKLETCIYNATLFRQDVGRANRIRYIHNYTIEHYGARMIEVFNYLEQDYENTNLDRDISY